VMAQPPADFDENPEWTAEDFARAKPFSEVFPEQLQRIYYSSGEGSMTRTWDQIFVELERLTAPEGCWTIEWNDNRASYMKVSEYAADWQDQFESQEEWRRSIQENRIVTLHWYVHTPVSSYKISCPDMDSLRRRVSALIDGVASESTRA
jgi:hypothetical protein